MPRLPQIPWFANQPGTFFVFRVNRRPWPDATLFTPERPPDVLDHFRRMLAPGYAVVTGRRSQRVWRVGGVEIDDETRTVVGKLGWQPLDEEVISEWSDEEKDWITTTTPQGGRVVPFGFDGDTRLLTVLREPRSSPITLGTVFERILRENERELEEPSTEWSVEAILDAEDFRSWLATLDIISLVSFTARLPNPEPRDAFRDLAERIEARRATSYVETLRSDREEGLLGIEEDHDVQQAIAMGEHGLATLRGEGTREGRDTTYSQRTRIAREHADELPQSWEGVWAVIKQLLKQSLRRFVEHDER